MIERPVKPEITTEEWTVLIMAAVADIGLDRAREAVARAIGEERTAALFDRRERIDVTKDDTRAIVRELYPIVPGVEHEEKVAWAIATGREAFRPDERFAEILAYVRHRVAEDEARQAEPETAADSFPWHKVSRYASIAPDVSEWAETKNLLRADIMDGSLITVLEGGNWPCIDVGIGDSMQGNFAIAVEQADGSIVVGTYEWNRCSHQTTKTLSNLAGATPFNLRSGARVWHFLTAPSRNNRRSVRERTNLVEGIWP